MNMEERNPALDLAMRVEADPQAADQFIGAGRDYGPLRIYGGHLLGQGLAAAFGTVEAERVAHSLHAYFLSVGDPGELIRYHVTRVREGRNYAIRAVHATQGERQLLTMLASFKLPEATDDVHQPPAPAAPEPTVVVEQRQQSGGEPLMLPFAGPFGIELEAVDGWHPRAASGQEPSIQTWMRAPMTDSADLRSRQCALAYLSDGTLMFNAVRPYGNAFDSHRATSLDHALWFHRDTDPGEWLLFDQNSPAAGDSRGLNCGRIFDTNGRLIASVTQESMMRRA